MRTARGSLAAAGYRQAMNRSGRTSDRAVAGALPVALPGAARVVVVAVEAADPHRVERDVRLRGELPGRFAPGLAVLAGDQQEPPRRDEVLDRTAAAVIVVDPGVRQRGTRAGGRLTHADVVGRRGARVLLVAARRALLAKAGLTTASSASRGTGTG